MITKTIENEVTSADLHVDTTQEKQERRRPA